MNSIATITQHVLIAIFVTFVWAPLLISLLYKLSFITQHVLMKNKMNAEFIKIHGHKSGTPNNGGLMISVTVFVLAWILAPASEFRNVFLVGWALFSMYGLSEELLVMVRKVDQRFRLLQETFGWRVGKLVILYIIALGVVSWSTALLEINQLTLFGDFIIPLNTINLLILSFLAILAIYGIEITDGADGLVTGQFVISISTYLVLSLVTGHAELLPYLGLMLGSSIVYLYFNISPARVFMGSIGTMPVAFALILFAAVTDTVVPFVIMGAVFWAELISSTIQILSMRFLKRKIFRIAPLHHHFEAMGWSESKVVQRFWLASGVAAIIALWVSSIV